ncbi:hypothetical protein UlMin_009611 [Ulmus minor]
MACISSVSYAFQLNGQKFGHLTPSRGLRQGDPLSPYLFLLCGEGLSSLLHHYEQAGRIQGLKCGLRGPTISHLLFADDSLLFLEAKTSACLAMKEVLNLYEAASGQAVNLLKSAVCFGPKLPEGEAASMAGLLGIPRVRCHEKYLGLPCFTGKNKQGIFSSIKDRVWNKLCGWKSKLLSAGGREILSKTVIQAIPSYAMNLFKLPISLINELHRLCAQFWWGGDSEKKRMHWCTWEKLCVHKADGGMGFRNLRLFNRALLAKQAWRIHSSPTSLVSRSGHYTVRSGYWLATKCNSVPSSSTSSHTSWWKRFWRLRIPSKIRVFLWKAYHNWIPSLANLARHGVPTHRRCPNCNETDDTTLHALWGCKILEPLKVLCDSFIRFKLPPQCDLKEFLLTANDCLSLENMEFLCVLLWRIWFRRNKWIHEQLWLDDESCFSWARQYLVDFQDANFQKDVLPKQGASKPWQAPIFGWVKVNSDAAWCSKQKKFGLGAIIRDSTGKVLGSVATPIFASVSVAVAEAWAIERGAALAKQLGFPTVVLESDCLAVIKALDLRFANVSEINYVMGNQVAHSLARLALSLESEQIWSTSTPESVNRYVIADMQHSSLS